MVGCSPFRYRSVCAIAIHELASLDLYHGRFAAAAKGYRRALWLAATVVPTRLNEVAANCIGLATVELNLCRFSRASFMAGIGWCLAMASRDLRHAAAAAAVQGLARKSLGRMAPAKNCFLRGLRQAKRANFGIEQARLLTCLGWLELDRAVIDGEEPGQEAPARFREGFRLAHTLRDSFYESDAQLGSIWSALANHDHPTAMELARSIPQSFVDELPEYIALGREATLGALAMSSSEFATASQHFARILNHASNSNSGLLWKSIGLIGAGSLAWHSGQRGRAQALWSEARSAGRRHSPFRSQVVDASIRHCLASASQPPQ